MTTYTQINATETLSGKPLTESLLTRLANNCLAIAEGDATAPKIQPPAIPDGLATSVASVQGTGNITLNFNHGDAINRNVIIMFDAKQYFPLSNSPYSYTLRVNGSTQLSASNLQSNSPDILMNGACIVSLGAGTHTIQLTLSQGSSGSSKSFLTAMVFKK